MADVVVIWEDTSGTLFLVSSSAQRKSNEFPDAAKFTRREGAKVAKELKGKAVANYGQDDEEVIADFQQ
jgi:hypothetical protein